MVREKSSWLVELGAWMSFTRQQRNGPTPYSGSGLNRHYTAGHGACARNREGTVTPSHCVKLTQQTPPPYFYIPVMWDKTPRKFWNIPLLLQRLFFELCIQPFGKNKVMTNLWDYGLVERRGCWQTPGEYVGISIYKTRGGVRCAVKLLGSWSCFGFKQQARWI